VAGIEKETDRSSGRRQKQTQQAGAARRHLNLHHVFRCRRDG
jgi:hypothetical protein